MILPNGRNNFNRLRRLKIAQRKFAYSSKSYANPYFQKRRPRLTGSDGASVKRKLAALASVFFLLIIAWLLFFSTLFKIKDIQVAGVGDNTAAEVRALAQALAENKLLGKNNLILFSKTQLSQALNEKYYLDSLTIKKKLFHVLSITLKEKQQAAIWQEDDKYYYLDSEGDIINQVDPLNINRSSFALIENQTGVKIDGRKANIGKPMIDYIIGLFNEFKDKKHEFEIEKFIIGGEANTVKMAILGGPKIYFNTREKVGEQAAKIDLLIKTKLKDSYKNKEYIDLRYGNNIYFK